MRAALPVSDDYASLNVTLDATALAPTIDGALGDWEKPLEGFKGDLKSVDQAVQEAKKYITADQVDGIAAGLFLLTWIVLVCVIIAMVLSAWRNPVGDTGAYFWWGAFTIAVIYLVLVVLPGFGWITAIALPMETVCAILPAQNEPATDLYRLMKASSGNEVEADVKLLIDDCVLDPQGFVWGATGLTKAEFGGELTAAFNVSAELENSAIQSTMDTGSQTASFNATEAEALSAPVYGVQAACPAGIASDPTRCAAYLDDMATYESDLALRVAAVQVAAANVTAGIAGLAAAAAAAADGLAAVKVDSALAVDKIIDSIWNLGKCTRVSNAYEGLRVPLCDGVAAGIFGTWGVLFIMAFFLYFLLFLVNKSAKMAYAQRHPEGPPGGYDDGKVHPGDGDEWDKPMPGSARPQSTESELRSTPLPARREATAVL